MKDDEFDTTVQATKNMLSDRLDIRCLHNRPTTPTSDEGSSGSTTFSGTSDQDPSDASYHSSEDKDYIVRRSKRQKNR